jgi:deazaflavin-dependent oxidoreductase (nitroreductase family)
VGFNEDLIADYRAHGKVTTGPFVGRDILLLTTVGARTKLERTHPLVFSRDRGDLIVVASRGGSPNNPHWFHNLRRNPIVTVELGTERFNALATPAEPEAERRRLYDRHAARNPAFREYESRTTRRIPVIRLEPLGTDAR